MSTFPTPSQARKKWNTRTDPVKDALAEALKRVLESCLAGKATGKIARAALADYEKEKA